MTRQIILIASLILFFVNVPAFANDETSDYQQRAISTLRGLKGVYILVELSPDIEQLGLTKGQIQTDVKIKLRTAGIRVIPEKEFYKEEAPFLSVIVGAKYNSSIRIFAAGSQIALHQLIILKRDPTIITYGNHMVSRNNRFGPGK